MANEDAIISKQGIIWHYEQTLDEIKNKVRFLHFQLAESHDTQGNAHNILVDALTANMQQHINDMELFLQKAGGEP